MRYRSFASLGTLVLLAAASAFGQQRQAFDIPFEFSFANTVMPAGHYDVTLSNSHSSGVLLVHCHTCGTSPFSVTTTIGGGMNQNTEFRLVFNKYGNVYFLAQAWLSPGSPWGIGLNKSKTEREIAGITPDVARVAIPAQTGAVALARR